MQHRLLALVFAIVFCVTPMKPILAQQGDGIQITLANTGGVPVGIFVPDADNVLQPLDIVIGSQEELELTVAPETMLVFAERFDDGSFGPGYYEALIGPPSAGAQIDVPDPVWFTPVRLNVANTLDQELALHYPDPDNADGWIEFARLSPGITEAYGFLPRSVIFAFTADGRISLVYEVGIEPEPTLDAAALATPPGGTVPVTVSNTLEEAVFVEEHRPGVIIRLASVEPGAALAIDGAIGAEFKFFTESGPAEGLGSYLVGEGNEQAVLVEDGSVGIPPPVELDLAVLPEDERESAARFVSNIRETFKDNPSITGYVVYNGSDEPVWFAGLKDGSIVGAKQVKPRGIGNIIARVGDFSIAWPADVSPDEVTQNDIYASIAVTEDMVRAVDITPPEMVRVSVENRLCKPIDLFRVDAFGTERLLTRLEPQGKAGEQFRMPVHSTLVARAGAASLLSGQALWTTRVGVDGELKLAIDADIENGYDALNASAPSDGALRTVFINNSTSRGLQLYRLDEEGRQILLPDGFLAPKENPAFEFPPGTVVVLRRPNVPPSISEYGRFRVTDAPNQEIDAGKLSLDSGLVGAWINIEKPALAETNSVGTEFINFVAQGGRQISGSTNIGDANQGGAVRFEGCTDNQEAFGYWYPKSFGFAQACSGPPLRDRAGVEQADWGRFSARRGQDGRLTLARGICDNNPDLTSSWFKLLHHYDDMDPSTDAFMTGFYNLKWAPKSFEWLGRGFDLLRTDPLNYGSTVARGVYSDKPLFGFIFEDAAGRATEQNSKKIFGVDAVNEWSSDARCSGDEKLVRSMKDLQDFASQSYSANVGVPNIASFSLSKSHSEKNTSATGNQRVFIMERCDVRRHELKMDLRWDDDGGYDSMRQPLQIEFRKAVEQLPLEWGDGKAVLAFLDKFGTHLSERITYGGTFYAETEVNKAIYQIASQVGDKLELAAEGTLKKVNLGGSYAEEESEGRATDNEHKATRYEKWSVGGNGSKIYESWANSLQGDGASLAPIDIGFRPIYDVITPVFFPEDPDIGIKNHLMRGAVDVYFRQFGKVDLTKDDPQALNQPDPRSICVQMDVVEYGSSYYGEKVRFVSELYVGFQDKAGGVVKNDKSQQLVFAPNNISTFFATEQNLNTAQCTEPVAEQFLYQGALFLHGYVALYPEGWGRPESSNELSANFPDGQHSLSLRRMEEGITRTLQGEIVLPRGEARYRMTAWVKGTVGGRL